MSEQVRPTAEDTRPFSHIFSLYLSLSFFLSPTTSSFFLFLLLPSIFPSFIVFLSLALYPAFLFPSFLPSFPLSLSFSVTLSVSLPLPPFCYLSLSPSLP